MTRVLFVGQDPKTVDFTDPALQPGLNAEKIQAGIDPVSYTHLDVYKRQASISSNTHAVIMTRMESTFPSSIPTEPDGKLSLIHI